ncbi:AIR synthase-related protein [Niabella ginsenosidivorans]|uniref:AIR synthase-related protein n=1 Tax=Niabella ginsenosidivorans TaxID=1176587 RepID=UPI000A6B6010|nr:AIR synthase-related protein [Niabella ginsenosidivorans]
MKDFGIHITYMGGETADVGDVVRTIAVNGTMTARWPKNRLITNEKIAPGNVIVGLASFGKTAYETEYNSGLASNGLTSARHDVLKKELAKKYPETFEPGLPDEVVYIGTHGITDTVEAEGTATTIGKLLLSPTRTFAPVIKALLEQHFDAINGLIHCSGGGQTKCMKYVPGHVKIIKDHLFEPPVIFDIIQKASGADAKEMYQVFNMGTRMEIYTNEKDAGAIIDISRSFGVEAQVIGRVEAAPQPSLEIHTGGEVILF